MDDIWYYRLGDLMDKKATPMTGELEKHVKIRGEYMKLDFTSLYERKALTNTSGQGYSQQYEVGYNEFCALWTR